jgi:hypothetical protein
MSKVKRVKERVEKAAQDQAQKKFMKDVEKKLEAEQRKKNFRKVA